MSLADWIKLMMAPAPLSSQQRSGKQPVLSLGGTGLIGCSSKSFEAFKIATATAAERRTDWSHNEDSERWSRLSSRNQPDEAFPLLNEPIALIESVCLRSGFIAGQLDVGATLPLGVQLDICEQGSADAFSANRLIYHES